MSIPILSRRQWKALPPKEIKPLKLPAKGISFSFTEGNTCGTKEECAREVRRLQKLSMDRGLSDIEYNFIIGGDKKIYRGRGWKEEVEEGAILVGYLGSATGDRDYAWRMVSKAYDLMMYALLKNYVEEVYKRPEIDLKLTREEIQELMIKDLRRIKL